MLSAKTSNDSEVEAEAENERQYNGDDTPKPELNDVGSQNVLSKKIWLWLTYKKPLECGENSSSRIAQQWKQDEWLINIPKRFKKQEEESDCASQEWENRIHKAREWRNRNFR